MAAPSTVVLFAKHPNHEEIYVFFSNGIVRQLTAVEWIAYGKPSPVVMALPDLVVCVALDKALKA